MMIWVSQGRPPPALLQLDRAGLVPAIPLALTQLVAGKLPWVRPLGGLAEALNR